MQGRGRDILPTASPLTWQRLRDGHARGRATYGEVGLELEPYALDVWTLTQRTRETLGHGTTPRELEAAIATRALGDLYLTRACERGGERAWEAFVHAFQKRLQGLAVRKSRNRLSAEHAVSAVLAELALPPPKGGARTRLGTYAGMGALWVWLSTHLVRAIWREQERRARTTELPHDAEDTRRVPEPVWAGQVAAETGTLLQAALERAWASLDAEQRLCFLLKHRDGWKQRRIGELLSLPEYQVSRSLARAVQRIRDEVEKTVPPPAGTSGSVWDHLAATFRERLARFGAEAHLPPEQA